ncbi:hypothetical protein L2E82_37427 [Cichorium intybus]|uniref:Uncharacterized protein n=1 Tax=Cichorium intybus TaxID=13427 RepID=A0ACB9ADH0_CICIN|nr:hypothetical protein L2E82_37427 [Cichorium intybus]
MASSSHTYSRGSRRQIVYSASSGSSDEEPEQQDFEMGDAGIAFMTDAQEARFYNFLERIGQAQKFVDIPTLRDLRIEAGVRKLLSNVGWEGFSAKASSIIHPVLKVTHRIIASIFFPQEEISKAGLNELELLYCMINPGPKTPNFGSWIMYKLLKLSRSSSGQVHCGGIITFIAKHPSLGIRFPDNLEIVKGERYLTSDVLEGMRLFRRLESDEIWQAGGRDYLRVNNRNARVLRLADPVSRTNWKPASNMGLPAPPPNPAEREPQRHPKSPVLPVLEAHFLSSIIFTWRNLLT